MSLLEIAQAVSLECRIEEPSSIAGNPNNTARTLLAFANREAQILSSRGGWQRTTQIHTFDTVVDVVDYDLPADYLYSIPRTEWDRTNRWSLIGPLSPQDREHILAWKITAVPRFYYWLRANKFTIFPKPDAIRELVFEYVSQWIVVDASGTPKAKFTADTDTTLVPEELFILGMKWRMLQSLTLDYAEAYEEYKSQVELYFSRTIGMRELSLSGERVYMPLASLPDTGYGQP